jgi:hypothetical protein
MKFKFIWFTALFIVFIGVGCSWLNNKPGGLSSIIPAGPKPANFTGASPAEASQRINFVPGSQIEIRQTYLGAEAKPENTDNKDGVRIITIERFAPMVYANLSWKLSRKVEGSTSSTEMRTVKGKMTAIDLKQSHQLYPPAYWPSEDLGVNGVSAIWLSETVFNELVKTKVAGLNYGILDSSLYGGMSASKDFAAAIKSLQDQADIAQTKGDLDLTKSDEQFSDWTLNVNGQKVKVQVLKVKNWFGEMVVLNNPQNPLILKMTYSPEVQDAAAKIKNNDLLATLLSFEITHLDNVQ